MSNHRMDYLIHASPPTPRLNPHRFEIVYTNRYDSVISIPVHNYAAAVIEAASLKRQGYEPIIKDGSAMDQPMAGQEMTQ